MLLLQGMNPGKAYRTALEGGRLCDTTCTSGSHWNHSPTRLGSTRWPYAFLISVRSLGPMIVLRIVPNIVTELFSDTSECFLCGLEKCINPPSPTRTKSLSLHHHHSHPQSSSFINSTQAAFCIRFQKSIQPTL